jgi:periplasmic protein TonB
MFEDSTFESMGRIHTHSRGWMIATFIFNGSILLASILIPLVYPEALSRQFIAFHMDPPPPASTQEMPKTQPVRAAAFRPEIDESGIHAPSVIPHTPFIPSEPEPASIGDFSTTTLLPGSPDGSGPLFHGPSVHPVVRPSAGPVRVPSSFVASTILRKTIPVYPPIAVAARVEGTVILQATIAKAGTIENLRVVSGPAMLQQAALDAVKNWVYRPYLLDGEPVEVETTVNVVFALGQY